MTRRALSRITPVRPARRVFVGRPEHVEDMPVVDVFLEALHELQRCRERFGDMPVLIDPERSRLDRARRDVVRVWTRSPVAA